MGARAKELSGEGDIESFSTDGKREGFFMNVLVACAEPIPPMALALEADDLVGRLCPVVWRLRASLNPSQAV